MNNFICLSTPNFSGNERKYVDAAIDAEWVSTAGAFINQFEEKMASWVGVPQACACQSGSAGLHLCLRHFGIGRGDLVLVPTLTFIATINAVMYQSAEPVFFDCDNHLCIDVSQVEKYLTHDCRTEDKETVEIASGKVVKAIIPVHVFGDHCDMDRLMQLAEDYHLYLIEDATESLGGTFAEGTYIGRHTGTVGHAGVYSFNGNKIITTGGGGMIVSNEPGVYKENSHGIRIENILVARNAEKNGDGQFMHFDTLTFVPIDKEAIDVSYMQPADIQRLNRYHAEVYEKIQEYLTEEEREWLKEATAPIVG